MATACAHRRDGVGGNTRSLWFGDGLKTAFQSVPVNKKLTSVSGLLPIDGAVWGPR